MVEHRDYKHTTRKRPYGPRLSSVCVTDGRSSNVQRPLYCPFTDHRHVTKGRVSLLFGSSAGLGGTTRYRHPCEDGAPET